MKHGGSRSMDRPVAVILTSRTLVMDLVRVPPGCTVIKLEPFEEARIKAWVGKWNALNLAIPERARRPLRLPDLMHYSELAAQPLLLLMLALYDAQDNTLANENEEFV